MLGRRISGVINFAFIFFKHLISDKSESIKNDNNLEQEQKNEIIDSDLEEQKNKEKIKRLEEINKIAKNKLIFVFKVIRILH